MKKTKKIWIIIAVSCIGAGLLIAAAAFAAMGFDYSGIHNITLQTKTYPVEEPFSDINISTDEGDIRFALSKDGVCRVECREDTRIPHTVSVDQGTLTVTRTDNRKWYERIGFFWGDTEITVYLPESVYGRLTLRSVSGDIVILEAFTFAETELFSTSGDITFESTARKGLKAMTVSGDLSVCNIYGEAAEVQSTSGGVCLKDAVVKGNISVETVSGEIQLKDCDAEYLRLKSVSGDIEGSLLSEMHVNFHTTSGEVQVSDSPSAAQECEVTTTSGDIRILTKGVRE